MSALAEFRIIDTNKLNDLKEKAEIKTIKKGWFKKVKIDEFWSFFDSNSNKLKDFDWSGYVFGNLLIFLQENKMINILDSEHDSIANWISEKRGISTIILTKTHKESYLEKLNSINITIEELIEFNKEFSEDSDPEFAKAGLEGVKAISENLEILTDDSKVIILTVR
ncbi:hypothetical protein [Carboxylicivirga marina]|uniref:hypothetical protein n=1 Tax=Carboxylicivirga marina TaxID=2800988 RepID=UPI00259198D7|nr:hypothetical protein [uncultured Carboxylicivirga sp.]